MDSAEIQIVGQLGKCGDREVFTAFARASLLAGISFADAFDESTGQGYQRRFNRQHSLEFKRYIQKAGASTIPLTFNLRPEFAQVWSIERSAKFPGMAVLRIRCSEKPIMSQVDCQHRLGYMADSSIEFAFMAYLGLSVTEEMEVFRDINGKAKGLSSSLLDSTEARLTGDKLSSANPELYHAMQLNENPKSVWHQRLDLGGQATVGTKRAASLRTMQHAVRRFLHQAHFEKQTPPNAITEILISFWQAIALVLPSAWENPRRHLVIKGIGVYSLMSIAGDLVREASEDKRRCDLDYFIGKLSDFVDKVDWSNNGPMKGYGGVKGADAALELLRHTRKQSLDVLKNYGKQTHSIN
jgi:DNA sulfur modification protein DndB